MKKILLFGAGKSATVLIDYLLQHAGAENWKLVVADANLQLALEKINHSPSGEAVSFDIRDAGKRSQYISEADLVISMLPPVLHNTVAKDCLQLGKSLLTASYVDNEMRSIAAAIKDKGLIFLCEMGLDPGIDHMSAMKIIDGIRKKGGKITSFRSHCGGLVAPESDDNPWHYKISWNPRNIILAGKAGAHYRENGKDVQLPYEELFTPGRLVTVPGYDAFSWYPNRDSLSYAPLYGLEETTTFIRTTLRHPDFMHGWKHVVDLKLTDETPAYQSDGKSLQELFREHLDKHGFGQWLNQQTQEAGLTSKQFLFLGLEDKNTLVNKGLCSAADLLQVAVETKLGLQPGDKDMIVMLHEFGYEEVGKPANIQSSLVVKGEDSLRTAMAKTVGLPLAIAAKLILRGTLKLTGLHIPTDKEIYEPVLKELAENGISFVESNAG
ncbi:MAG TPA: saccharopine dehydrogenase C-terminal domain-containing protein [Chitinophagaceae bacterium]|nr:saccharopine dehydrogenase C-terminal domain-containing protein [Chitinophagaceae bacterium]